MDIEDLKFKREYLKRLANKGYNYLAQDKDDSVWAYQTMPTRLNKRWVVIDVVRDYSEPVNIINCGVSWEDVGPTPIARLIKEYDRFISEVATEEHEKFIEKADEVITNSDMVNSPNHYTWKARECKYIQADMVDGLEGMVAHHMADVIKYLYRVGHKDDIKQDLEKAKKNIDFIIEEMTGEKQL